mmetsp:Transcript_21670/g.33282  ORF Transcript_21670/g.33282 Transcript_21670/m.33282 type:complete len:584 (+) Transcript_21670:57-1808(+)
MLLAQRLLLLRIVFGIASASWLENGMPADLLEIEVLNEGRGKSIQVSASTDITSTQFLIEARRLCTETFLSSDVENCVQSLQQYLFAQINDSLPFTTEVLRAAKNKSFVYAQCPTMQREPCAQVIRFGPKPINQDENIIILPGDVLAIDIQILGRILIGVQGVVCLGVWRHPSPKENHGLMLASSCYSSQPDIVHIPDAGQSHRVRLSGEGLLAGNKVSVFTQLRDALQGKALSILQKTDIFIAARGLPCGYGLYNSIHTKNFDAILNITSPKPGSTFLPNATIQIAFQLLTESSYLKNTDEIFVCLRLGGLTDFGGVELESSGVSLGCLTFERVASIQLKSLSIGVHGILAYATYHDVAVTPTTTTWFQILEKETDTSLTNSSILDELHIAVSPYETMGGVHGHDNKLEAITSAIRALLLHDIYNIHFCETGLNAGYSAVAALSVDIRVQVTSFDIAENAAVTVAKSWIDQRFPNRHSLIYGTSTITLPLAIETGIPPCDLVFVDGGHEEDTAEADMRNFLILSRPQAPLIVDDISCSDPTPGACDGPGVAWRRLLAEGLIVQIECPDDHGGSFCVGYYNTT